MQTLLFSKTLRSKKHVVAVRERARQVARLLRFPPLDQAVIASAALVVAYHALKGLVRPRLVVGLDEGKLCIEAQGEPGTSNPSPMTPLYRFTRSLPATLEVSAADLAWIVAQVTMPRTTDLFEEIHQQNQELLALAHTLQERERELAKAQAERSNPSAA